MQPQEEEVFTRAILEQIQQYLSDVRRIHPEEEVEKILQRDINKLPNFLQTAAIEKSVIRQFRLFLEILLVNYREYKTQSTDFIVQVTLYGFKQHKKVPTESVRTPRSRPRPRSVQNVDLRNRPLDNSPKIDFTKLASQQPLEPLLNTTSSARNQPTPISHKSPVEKREDVISINLLGNTDSIIAWFVKNASVSTPQGDSFNVPVVVDKKVYTLVIFHKKPCDNPNLLIVLCDKDKSHTELLQKLKTVNRPFLFLRTDEKKSANENIMTQKIFKKLNFKAEYYDIDPEGSALGQLQATFEKIPETLGMQVQDKKEKESCLVM